jgi:hypothetical protein
MALARSSNDTMMRAVRNRAVKRRKRKAWQWQRQRRCGAHLLTEADGWLDGWLVCSPVHRDAIPLDWLLGVRGNERVVDTDRVADERARSDGEGRAGHTWTAAVLDVALTLNDVPKL